MKTAVRIATAAVFVGVAGLSCAGIARAAEDLHGVADVLYPPTLTLYGGAHDLNNPTNNTYFVRVCWDSQTANCDAPTPANLSRAPLRACTSNCFGYQYSVPAGSVGSVTPRDGRSHLMYVKIISQQNPGAGDTPVDGSPFPFTYKNGTAGPLWKANLGTPGRLTAAQLAVLANSQDSYSVGASGATVCTVSGVAIKDDGVVGYYVRRHAVPCANVRVVSLPVTPVLQIATFNAGLLPTLQALPSSLQAVAVGWIEPSVVRGATDQAMSSAVANRGLVTGTGCYDGQPGLGQGPINPYFNSTSHTPFTTHGIRPTMMLAGEICPTCTANNTYSHAWVHDIGTAKAFIDAAISGVDSDPVNGHVDLAWTSDLGRSVNAINASPTIMGSGLSPKVYTQVLGDLKSPEPNVIADNNILLYAQGSASWVYSHPTFVRGAGIGYALTSTSGFLPYDGIQTNAASWLSYGAVASHGNAVEPCELLVYKSPDVGIVIPNYVQGQTAVEALWKSVRLPWGSNFVGDPLASPFSVPAQSGPPALLGLSPASAPQGGTAAVTLTGSNFTSGSVLAISGTGVTVSNVSVVNANQINATFSVSPSASVGTHNVTVSTSAGVSSAQVFSVTAIGSPVLSSIAPSSGAAGTVVAVTLTGTNFVQGASIAVSGAGISVSNVVIGSATQITASLSIAANAATGARSITVVTPKGISRPASFTVAAAPLPPVLSDISPATGAQGSAVDVVLTGNNFAAGSTLTISGSGVTASNVTVIGATQIAATLNIAASAQPGSFDIGISSAGGSSGVLAFAVTPAASAPVLLSVSPATGHPGEILSMVISGANFTPASTLAVQGDAIAVSNLVVVDSNTITATFQIAASTLLHPRNVVVSDPSGASNATVFTVN